MIKHEFFLVANSQLSFAAHVGSGLSPAKWWLIRVT